MEKTGELTADVSRCDECGDLATIVVGRRAYCSVHAPEAEKQAAATLKSFTDPIGTP